VLVAWLFSVAHHPRYAIADPLVRRRYQRRRSVVAILGGIVGGVGVGLTFSHSGLVGTDVRTAVWLPVLVGVLLAVAFVWLPMPVVIRWLVAAGLVVCTMAFMDLSLGWQLGLGFVGLAVSWVVAVLLQYGIGVVRITARDFVKALGAVVLIGLAALAATADPSPAGAQSTGESGAEGAIGPCPAGRLEIEVDGDRAAFSADGSSEPIVVHIDGSREITTIQVSARSDLQRGTIVIELDGLEPIPLLARRPVVVWTGDLAPAGFGGATETTDVRIVRPTGRSVLRAEAGSHDADLGLIAGLGRYRATLTDPGSGVACHLDGSLRVIAGPLDTLPGRVGVGAALFGLGLSSGSLLGGSVRPRAAGELADGRRDRWPEPRVPVPVGRPRVELLEQRKLSPPGQPPLEYELVLQLRMEDREDDVYTAEATGSRWIDSVRFTAAASFSGPGLWHVPIQIRTDPKEVQLDPASFDITLTGRSGLEYTVCSLSLPTESESWDIEVLGDEAGIGAGARRATTTGAGR
jgi:hypothetical protein